MIYRRGKTPHGARFAVYKCPKCGFDTEIAGFIRKVTVKCGCGSKQPMIRIAIGIQKKDHLQLLLPIEGANEKDQ